MGLLRKRQRLMKVQEDLFLELPDHIIHKILSLLPLRDAARTTVLSKNWRDYFMSYPHLCFDASNILGDMVRKDCLNRTSSNDSKKRSEFVMRVDKFMLNRRLRNEKIDSFTICYSLDFNSKYSFNLMTNWIRTAISKQVEEIKLNLFDMCSLKVYAFPYALIMKNQGRKSTVKHLHLDYCGFESPSRFECSSSLITMGLKRVVVSDKHLVNVLDTCSSLEWLSLDTCPDLINLDVTSGSLQNLKYLNISTCCRLEHVEICNTNLIEFEYSGPSVRWVLKVPKVTKLSLSFISGDRMESVTDALTRLPARFPALETFNLLLNLDMKTFILPEYALTFTNVKQLILTIIPLKDDDDFVWLTYVLKAFPLLQKLQLNLFSSSCFSTREIGIFLTAGMKTSRKWR